MVKVEIEKPKEFYEEVKRLIGYHYNSQSPKNFEYSKDSFAKKYPVIYSLFLTIVALGLRGEPKVVHLRSPHVKKIDK